MFIPEISVRPNLHFTNNLFYVPDDYVDKLWSIISSPYIGFMEANFKGANNPTPIIELDSVDQFEGYVLKMNFVISARDINMAVPEIPYIRNCGKSKFSIHSIQSRELSEYYLKDYLMSILMQRISKLMCANIVHYFPNIVDISTFIDNPRQFKLSKMPSDPSHRVINVCISKNVMNYTHEIEEAFSTECENFGKLAVKYVHHPDKIDTEFYSTIDALNYSIVERKNPVLMRLANVLPDYHKCKYYTALFINGRRAIFTCGSLESSSFATMQWKIIQEIDRCKLTDDIVLINGFLNYLAQ